MYSPDPPDLGLRQRRGTSAWLRTLQAKIPLRRAANKVAPARGIPFKEQPADSSLKGEAATLDRRPRRVYVIANPAAGRSRPVLGTINDVFIAFDVDWDIAITKRGVPTREIARRALETEPDVIVVYGGDGTIAEVAYALIGSEIPMAILPGGTSNALALELGIPIDLAAACRLAVSGQAQIRRVDAGDLGDRLFLVAVGMGWIPADMAAAEHEDKSRFGTLAYLVRALQALGKTQPVRYRIGLDEREEECSGVVCLIANSSGFGLPGLSLAPTVWLDDGLLDVLVIKDTDVSTILSLAARVLQLGDAGPAQPVDSGASAVGRPQRATPGLMHWQARQVRVVSDPPQPIQADGELLECEEIRARVLEGAVGVLAPSVSRAEAPSEG